jgi:hypothetical protein
MFSSSMTGSRAGFIAAASAAGIPDGLPSGNAIRDLLASAAGDRVFTELQIQRGRPSLLAGYGS